MVNSFEGRCSWGQSIREGSTSHHQLEEVALRAPAIWVSFPRLQYKEYPRDKKLLSIRINEEKKPSKRKSPELILLEPLSRWDALHKVGWIFSSLRQENSSLKIFTSDVGFRRSSPWSVWGTVEGEFPVCVWVTMNPPHFLRNGRLTMIYICYAYHGS